MCWKKAVEVSVLQQAGGLLAQVIDGVELAFYAVEDDIYATSDLCTHGAARLSQGYLIGELIECPMHQGMFDVRTGAAAGPPCTHALQTFPVRVKQGVIFVRLPTGGSELGEDPA